MNEQISDYLKDESGIQGYADDIFVPDSLECLSEGLRQLNEHQAKMTIQGARTGICGGAVPKGGTIINMTKLNHILDFNFDMQTQTGEITVEAGVTLHELTRALRDKVMDTSQLSNQSMESWNEYVKSGCRLFFPPNPSEQSATIGGVIACGASGSHQLGYGKLNDYVGDMVIFNQTGELVTADYNSFIGTEGIFGIIGRVTLKLIKMPRYHWGLLAFSDDPIRYFPFVKSLKEKMNHSVKVISYMDQISFDLLKEFEHIQPGAAKYSDILKRSGSALWIELAGDDEAALTEDLEEIVIIMDTVGINPDETLAAMEDKDFERLQPLRHFITEVSNSVISKQPQILDFQSDWDNLENLFSDIRSILINSGLRTELTGQLGMNQVHIRILPQSSEEEKNASFVYQRILALCREKGCICSCEYGVGRLKKQIFASLNPAQVSELHMQKVKVDSLLALNQGVLIDMEVS